MLGQMLPAGLIRALGGFVAMIALKIMKNSQDKPLTYQEYRDGIDELQNTEGWQISKKIEHLGLSAHIFKTNHDELIQRIEYFKRPEAIVLWDVRNNAQMEHYLKEVSRLLHNFVASAKTLVEHTRIIAREMYGSTDFWKEYESQIAQRFTSNPLVRFIHELRNYILHYDLPLTSASLTPKHDSLLKINITTLRKWKGWKGPSRQYVSYANDEETIEDIVRGYTSAIINFHDWFNDRQHELHKEAFEAANELRQRLVSSQWHWKIK
jgi:hypothetical protein